MFIANTIDEQPDAMPVAPMAPPRQARARRRRRCITAPAYWIKVSAQQDGTFTVTNARNGFSKTYRPE